MQVNLSVQRVISSEWKNLPSLDPCETACLENAQVLLTVQLPQSPPPYLELESNI